MIEWLIIGWFCLWVIVSAPFEVAPPVRQVLFAVVLVLIILALTVGPVIVLRS
jgi:hypothetical protein